MTWDTIGVGIERARLPVPLAGLDVTAFAYALRLDPARVTFRVHYESDNPRDVVQWREDLGAAIVINGSFFSGDFRPVGRIVSEGFLYGFPLDYPEDSIGVPGLFTILEDEAAIFSAGRAEFTPRGMRFDAALECYPMLLLPGGQPGFSEETGLVARRSVVGVDTEGNVLLIVVDVPALTLFQLARWLADLDLDLDSALNLDGGRSTGLAVNIGAEQLGIPSVVEVPIVLAVYPR